MESSRYLLRVLIDRPFPDWWGLIVGDFVQNLRAALDQLVCQMVYAKGEEPDRHAFPIFTTPPAEGTPAARTWNRMLAGLDPEAVAFIERCQPYHGPDGPRVHAAAIDLMGHSDPVIEAELDQLLGDAPE